MKKIIPILLMCCFFINCKNQQGTNNSSSQDVYVNSNKGQAFIEDEASKKNILQIAISSKDHTTLVAAVQAAGVENALVNVGPLTVFAPVNSAFEALPKGTLDELLMPKNKNILADILKYHVTPGNLSVDIIKKLKKLGQANNQDLSIEINDKGELTVGGAKIIKSINAGNGIIHVIDKVLLPPSPTKN